MYSDLINIICINIHNFTTLLFYMKLKSTEFLYVRSSICSKYMNILYPQFHIKCIFYEANKYKHKYSRICEVLRINNLFVTA